METIIKVRNFDAELTATRDFLINAHRQGMFTRKSRLWWLFGLSLALYIGSALAGAAITALRHGENPFGILNALFGEEISRQLTFLAFVVWPAALWITFKRNRTLFAVAGIAGAVLPIWKTGPALLIVSCVLIVMAGVARREVGILAKNVAQRVRGMRAPTRDAETLIEQTLETAWFPPLLDYAHDQTVKTGQVPGNLPAKVVAMLNDDQAFRAWEDSVEGAAEALMKILPAFPLFFVSSRSEDGATDRFLLGNVAYGPHYWSWPYAQLACAKETTYTTLGEFNARGASVVTGGNLLQPDELQAQIDELHGRTE